MIKCKPERQMDPRSMIQPPLSFSVTSRSIIEEAEKLIQQMRHQQDVLVQSIALPKATFSNVIEPLARADDSFSARSNLLCFYQHVSQDEKIREASEQAQKLLGNFRTESYMRQDIFALINVVHSSHKELGTQISEDDIFLLNRMHELYLQSGASLEHQHDRSRYQEITARLAEMKTAFQKNLRGEKVTLSFSREEMEGVPDKILENLDTVAGDEKRYLVTLPDHEYMGIMALANRSETRQRIFMALENRCAVNGPLLQEALALRYQAAHLLGFPSNAARKINGRMAKSVTAVQALLDDIRQKLIPAAQLALKTLKEHKQGHQKSCAGEDPNTGQFFLWDYEYYQRQVLQQRLSIDRQVIREYFPLQTTVNSMMAIFSTLFELEFDEMTDMEKWQEDVTAFAVFKLDEGNKRHIGFLYLDLFHREGKYANATCFNLQPGYTQSDGCRHLPSVALLCDFSRPTPTEPTLLGHFQMVTLLHELGHCMHDLLCETEHSIFHGPDSVPVDFGELPSQMLEEWCWEPTQLKKLSFHYSYLDPHSLDHWKSNSGHVELIQPEKHMPDEMIHALIQARRITFGPLFHLDQLHRAAFDIAINDLEVSNEEAARSINLASIWNKLRKDICLLDGPEALGCGLDWGHGYASFSHLMLSDYDTGYYSYLFSRVFAVDLFCTRFQNDLGNTETAQMYIQHILARGGCQDYMQALTDFLRRPPGPDAFNQHMFDSGT